jgi:hypothetical protein
MHILANGMLRASARNYLIPTHPSGLFCENMFYTHSLMVIDALFAVAHHICAIHCKRGRVMGPISQLITRPVSYPPCCCVILLFVSNVNRTNKHRLTRRTIFFFYSCLKRCVHFYFCVELVLPRYFYPTQAFIFYEHRLPE